MTFIRHSSLRGLNAVVLSLTLVATGSFGVAGVVPQAHASITTTDINPPVGGAQLAAPGVIVNLAPGVPPPPPMPGASFLIADMDTGLILAARAPHEPRLPASTLKTLTALTLIPTLDAKTMIVVKPEDVAVEGSHLGILAGTAYSVETLLQGLMMASGNDAAYALARGNGSVTKTLKAMNATAADLNAFDTVAKDPSGLDKPGQTSSSYDLALIARAAMKLPDFRVYVSKKQTSVPGGFDANGKLKRSFTISTHNKLLHNYPGAIGIKSGYTIAARQTYIGAATRGGKTYIVTQMASPTGSWRPHAALLDWAFAHGDAVKPIGDLVEPGPEAPPKPTVKAHPQSPPSPPPPHDSALPAFPPWLGIASLMSIMTVIGAWRRHHLSRRRRNRRRR
ncbi:MAG: D-alanyl-D-alanine carboxypeptidase [Pyrinomonadaceae bacterium]|nr:D-alanyl-D-alanine carboxypeptidase [Phycisphaerales bacterium]